MENIRDKRLIPANKRIGWIKSYPACSAPNLVDGELKRVISQYANLLSKPKGDRVRQLVYGDTFRVLEENDGFSFGFNKFDGYVGYIQNDKLKKRSTKTTHWVSSLSTQIFIHMLPLLSWHSSPISNTVVDIQWSQPVESPITPVDIANKAPKYIAA